MSSGKCRCRSDIREAQRQRDETAAAFDRLQPWAFIYMTTSKGGAEVPMYLAARADAEAFCSDERTKGVGPGGPWMFLFTSASNYLFNPLGHSSLTDLAKASRVDDGRFAPLCAELGITLHGRDEFEAILAPLLAPRRDPVATVRATGDDNGLFDLLDEEDAS